VRPVGALPLALGLALVAGCGGTTVERQGAPKPEPRRPRPASAAAPRLEPAPPACPPGARQRLGGKRLAFAALVVRPARAFRAPGRRPIATFALRNVNGHRTVLAVRGALLDRDCRPLWYRVQLPLWPNGITGYVRARDVRVYAVATRIEVDLSQRRLTFFRLGRPLWRLSVGIGAPRTPTPTGSFYVNQRLVPSDPRGPFGPGAIGISAYSEVLRDWPQGGPIAIHGTNEPWSVGKALSHGCLRVENRALRRLFAATPAGTPVVIHP
jgi:hypothetical protein